jgi:putative transposase
MPDCTSDGTLDGAAIFFCVGALLFLAEHWLKSSNPIESPFAAARLRTRVTRGPGSRTDGLVMVFKLLEAAQEHWRYVNGAHLVALVRAGATFEKGVLVERPEQAAQEMVA